MSRHRTIADRILGMRLEPSRRLVKRDVSYEFMNRQMVWHAFTVSLSLHPASWQPISASLGILALSPPTGQRTGYSSGTISVYFTRENICESLLREKGYYGTRFNGRKGSNCRARCSQARKVLGPSAGPVCDMRRECLIFAESFRTRERIYIPHSRSDTLHGSQ